MEAPAAAPWSRPNKLVHRTHWRVHTAPVTSWQMAGTSFLIPPVSYLQSHLLGRGLEGAQGGAGVEAPMQSAWLQGKHLKHRRSKTPFCIHAGSHRRGCDTGGAGWGRAALQHIRRGRSPGRERGARHQHHPQHRRQSGPGNSSTATAFHSVPGTPAPTRRAPR